MISRNAGGGWGVIAPAPPTDPPDVFVHVSDIEWPGYRPLERGDEVEFELVAYGEHRYAGRATGVRPLNERM